MSWHAGAASPSGVDNKCREKGVYRFDARQGAFSGKHQHLDGTFHSSARGSAIRTSRGITSATGHQTGQLSGATILQGNECRRIFSLWCRP
jgi:hypothetical protein